MSEPVITFPVEGATWAELEKAAGDLLRALFGTNVGGVSEGSGYLFELVEPGSAIKSMQGGVDYVTWQATVVVDRSDLEYWAETIDLAREAAGE